jgi:hypothetical protein
MEKFEDLVVGHPKLRQIGEKIKAHIDKVLPDHLGHKVRIYYDGYHLVWIQCLDCNILWDHCDFCKHSRTPETRGAKKILDLGCHACQKWLKLLLGG